GAERGGGRGGGGLGGSALQRQPRGEDAEWKVRGGGAGRDRRREPVGRASQNAPRLLATPSRARLGGDRPVGVRAALPGRAAAARPPPGDERSPRDGGGDLGRIGSLSQRADHAHAL